MLDSINDERLDMLDRLNELPSLRGFRQTQQMYFLSLLIF